MGRKRLLEAQSPQERATQCQRLGTLRNLAVQPATKRRYHLVTQAFSEYLEKVGLALPTQKSRLDALELRCGVWTYLRYLGRVTGQSAKHPGLHPCGMAPFKNLVHQ